MSKLFTKMMDKAINTCDAKDVSTQIINLAKQASVFAKTGPKSEAVRCLDDIRKLAFNWGGELEREDAREKAGR